MKKIVLIALCSICTLVGDNQTADLTPVLVDQQLPFDVSIKLAFTMPVGIQAAAAAQCGSQYLFIAGRVNGLHGFAGDSSDFPPDQQNTTVFVINPCTKTVYSRSLHDPLSGLTQAQIDSLSVTSPQFYQRGNTLYLAGGYGVETSTGNFTTKNTLSAINVPGLIYWVTHPQSHSRASQYIRQTSNPLFQVAGGQMYQFGKNPTLLMFGQNFNGDVGDYSEQVRRFCIIDNGVFLRTIPLTSTTPDPNYRRTDLNIVPIIKFNNDNKKIAAYLALSGVFTESFGVWTVPVDITATGKTSMTNPSLSTTFKQGMNNFVCPHVELLSKSGSMYIALFGGITYEYFQDGEFVPDPELPFTNQVTVIKRSKKGNYKQYLLPNQYPTILSTASNPGNTLLFGASGKFMPAADVPMYSNGVLNLEKIKKPTVIGYIIGGVQSTVPNTSVPSDSAASPYVFKVILTPRCKV